LCLGLELELGGREGRTPKRDRLLPLLLCAHETVASDRGELVEEGVLAISEDPRVFGEYGAFDEFLWFPGVKQRSGSYQ
jgi:hypothetical protein